MLSVQTACQCIHACPTGALHEVYHYDNVWKALNDPEKHVIVQTAPAVRVAIAEPFGCKAGTIATGQMVTALKRLGFDRVLIPILQLILLLWKKGQS